MHAVRSSSSLPITQDEKAKIASRIAHRTSFIATVPHTCKAQHQLQPSSDHNTNSLVYTTDIVNTGGRPARPSTDLAGMPTHGKIITLHTSQPIFAGYPRERERERERDGERKARDPLQCTTLLPCGLWYHFAGGLLDLHSHRFEHA